MGEKTHAHELKLSARINFYDKRNNMVYLLVVFTSPTLWTILLV
jgi:hypothetical protein